MNSVDLTLTEAHWRAGMRRYTAALLAHAPRTAWVRTAGVAVLHGFLGAFVVAGFYGASRLDAGAGRLDAAVFAAEVNLIATASVAALALLWLGWREMALRRGLRSMGDAVPNHFAAPKEVRIGWGWGELRWESEEGTGGMPLADLHAWEDEEAEDGLLLIYVAWYHFLPVPLDQFDFRQALSLRRALREASVPRQWWLPPDAVLKESAMGRAVYRTVGGKSEEPAGADESVW